MVVSSAYCIGSRKLYYFIMLQLFWPLVMYSYNVWSFATYRESGDNGRHNGQRTV